MEDVIEKVWEIDQNDELYVSMLSQSAIIHDLRCEKQQELINFLRHIIDQHLEIASRRNKWYFGYLSELRLRNA